MRVGPAHAIPVWLGACRIDTRVMDRVPSSAKSSVHVYRMHVWWAAWPGMATWAVGLTGKRFKNIQGPGRRVPACDSLTGKCRPCHPQGTHECGDIARCANVPGIYVCVCPKLQDHYVGTFTGRYRFSRTLKSCIGEWSNPIHWAGRRG